MKRQRQRGDNFVICEIGKDEPNAMGRPEIRKAYLDWIKGTRQPERQQYDLTKINKLKRGKRWAYGIRQYSGIASVPQRMEIGRTRYNIVWVSQVVQWR